MTPHPHSTPATGLVLRQWRYVPMILIDAGVIGATAGLALGGPRQFAYSWLLAYMFFLSLCLGALFLVMMHHLFDANWSVPTRRLCEHMACLLGLPMILLFLPIAFLAKYIYGWMDVTKPDHAVAAKYPLFTMPGFYISAAVILGVWWFYSNRLRHWSLLQDQSGSAQCTRRMRFYSASGIFLFALTLTLASIVWMKGLMPDWYSTMYGVWYFASSVWAALPTVYIITLLLQQDGPLRHLVKDTTYYMIGSLFLAFTVFWGYISFAQYFIVWNANIPEETFWYVLRENGQWDVVGKYVIVFGHFFVPFLMLLRIDLKLKLSAMVPLAAWCWLMHFVDLEFQIMPALHPRSILTSGLLVDISCMLLFTGVLTKVFMASFLRHPAYPLRDPRLAESLGVYFPPSPVK